MTNIYIKETLDSNELSDICNGRAHKALEDCANVFSLIMFADSASFDKANSSIWTVFFAISNLPFASRFKKENIITFLVFNSHKVNFNNIFHENAAELLELTNKGLFLARYGQVKIKVLGLMSDLVALPKLLNTVQYNSRFACIKCLHPGKIVGTEASRPKLTYPYSKTIPVRTTASYNSAVKQSIRTQQVHDGVKGATFLVKLLSIPEQIILDSMHMVFEGTQKQLLELWLLSKYHKKPWYIGKCQSLKKQEDQNNLFEQTLMKAKYPSEFPRTQRTINLFATFKANEYRNFIYYSGYISLKNILPKKYLDHYLLYVNAIRLLTQDFITLSDIEKAELLLKTFYLKFKTLYGPEHVRFNLHLHIHLAEQTRLFGPIHKLNSFGFEGKLKIQKNLK